MNMTGSILQGPIETTKNIANGASNLPTRAWLRIRLSSAQEQELKLRARLTPPKPHKRKRRLSLPVEDGFKAYFDRKAFRKPKAFDQTQSRLLQLPGELRMLIYEYVIGEEEIKISRKGYGIRPCRSYYDGAYGVIGAWRRVGNVFHWGTGVMGLLCSCRVMYTEFVSVLYSTPIFRFIDIHAFFAFMTTILPQRRAQISYVQLDFKPAAGIWPFSLNYLDYEPIRCVKARSPLPGLEQADDVIRIMSFQWAVDEILKDMPRLKRATSNGSVVSLPKGRTRENSG